MFVHEQATILHADLDSFYASVEQRDDPRLRGRPVIVGGGVVLAASYEAKAFGVRTAMGAAQARRLCPRAVVVRPRIDAYVEASRAVFAVFDDTTPLVEGLSIDEAFLDVGGLRRSAGPPCPRTVTPARCRSGAAAAPSVPSTPSAGRRPPPGTRRKPSTPSSSAWSTGSPAGCGRRVGSAAPSCCGCASTTSPGPPGPTR